ncbi:MAG: (2Fe-2S) ferredoxin domain-containing protein [Sphingomonadales bacterium]|nr:(2Fe-2S) ferredoxin domain-containing protein [Sphingomonadales bacterium]
MTTRRAKARWSNAVLVCRKCSKKLKQGGFGPDGDRPLAKALRKHLQTGKGPKSPAGIVEVGCLDLCPKRAVTVVDGRHPDQWLVVRPGANLDALAHELGLKPGPG